MSSLSEEGNVQTLFALFHLKIGGMKTMPNSTQEEKLGLMELFLWFFLLKKQIKY
jgi:hypothetical protein